MDFCVPNWTYEFVCEMRLPYSLKGKTTTSPLRTRLFIEMKMDKNSVFEHYQRREFCFATIKLAMQR